MSFKTWCVKHYPITASKLVEDQKGLKTSERLRAIAYTKHSIRKWEGLEAAAMEEHGVIKDRWSNRVYGRRASLPDSGLRISGSSCALCSAYLDKGDSLCDACPLAWYREWTPCDQGDDPYNEFAIGGDPKPMLEALRGCLEWLEGMTDEEFDEF